MSSPIVCFVFFCLSNSVTTLTLRKFEVVESISLQDWKVETRKRMSGKLKGNLYKVYINPEGVKYYSLSKAIKEGGFVPDESTNTDGRKTRRKRK